MRTVVMGFFEAARPFDYFGHGLGGLGCDCAECNDKVLTIRVVKKLHGQACPENCVSGHSYT